MLAPAHLLRMWLKVQQLAELPAQEVRLEACCYDGLSVLPGGCRKLHGSVVWVMMV